ncbi:MAG: hypothetical protein JAY74_19730 [Candidatus Thiodiazotropha taylori]|nr:hypothetical protein [Candidatus Thiodiazotropha taylori]
METIELESCSCIPDIDEQCLYCFIREDKFEQFINSSAVPELTFEGETSTEVSEAVKNTDIQKKDLDDDLNSTDDPDCVTILDLDSCETHKELTIDTNNYESDGKGNLGNDDNTTDNNGQHPSDKQQT